MVLIDKIHQKVFHYVVSPKKNLKKVKMRVNLLIFNQTFHIFKVNEQFKNSL